MKILQVLVFRRAGDPAGRLGEEYGSLQIQGEALVFIQYPLKSPLSRDCSHKRFLLFLITSLDKTENIPNHLLMNIMEQQLNKRQLERTLFSYPVIIECNDPESERFGPIQLQASGIDINSNGIGILTEKPLNPGGMVKIYLPLGDPKTMIATLSEVRWTRPLEGKYRMGLHFIV